MTKTSDGLGRRAALRTLAAGAAAPLFGAGLAGAGMVGAAHAAAPMMGVSRPSHFRYKLGDFEITAIFDGAVNVPQVHPIFGNDQSPEAVADLVTEHFLPADRMAIAFTPIIVNTGREVVAFDVGNGAGRREVGAGRLAAALASAGFSPDQIDVVVLSHYHPDHIGGLMEGGQPLFPNARYVTSQVEFDFWTHPDRAQGRTEGVARLVQANVAPLAEKMTFIKPGDDVVTGITAVDAMGHTPGHTAFHLESGTDRLLHFVDACNHYIASMQRPDWHVAFDMDKEKAAAARNRILDLIATDRILSSGYHMPFPAVGFVDRFEAAYRWVPVSYQV